MVSNKNGHGSCFLGDRELGLQHIRGSQLNYTTYLVACANNY